MEIPAEILKKWNPLKEHGDIKSISEESGISRQTIATALEKEEATEEVFQAINSFYAKRLENIKSAGQKFK